MRTVTEEEAQASRERLLAWAATKSIPSNGTIGEWLFNSGKPQEQDVVEEEIMVEARTPIAIQRNWKTPSEFPMCPDSIGSEPLGEYANRLDFGTVFSRTSFGEALTVVAEQGGELLSVLCKLAGNPIKEWALTNVAVENGKFVHESVRTYFSLQGALKEHCELLDVPLNESIDDCS